MEMMKSLCGLAMLILFGLWLGELNKVPNPPATAVAQKSETPSVIRPAAAQEIRQREVASSSAVEMIQMLGCKSPYSEEKAADVFAQKFKGKLMTARGSVETNKDGTIGLKLLKNTFTYDVLVHLSDKSQSYNLEKGDVVTVKFVVKSHGGCFLSFSGEEGVILQQ
jgi:hypothetical protein